MTSRLFRRSMAFMATLLLTLAAASGAQAQAVNISGTWTFSVTTEAGTTTPTVTIVHEGNELTGRYVSDQLGEADFTGTVEGSTFRFSFPVDMQGTAVTVVYAGTIESAESLTGTLDIAGLAGGPFTAVPREET